jgi:thioredoxin reductase (NADPH)
MSAYLIDQIAATPNIEVITNTVVTEVFGEDRLTGFKAYHSDTDEEQMIEAPAMFVFIGAVPHTEMVEGVVERNRAGFILTGQDLIQDGKPPRGWTLARDPYLLETSVPGIFAAGDVRQGAVRRVASAVGQGAIAVSFVHQYLRTV